MTRHLGINIVLGAALAISASAVAATPTWSTDRVAVSAAGLDLSSHAGRQTLDRRVNAAISAMCGAPVLGTRDEADALRLCRDEARTAAAPAVDRLLTRASVTVASSRP